MRDKGFIIAYTIIVVGVVMIMVTVFSNIILNELDLTQSERQSLKAFYAADTGVECARHYQNEYDAFDTTSERDTYDCGVGTFEAGLENPPDECVEHTYNFSLEGFNNGACADVEVTVTTRTINLGGDEVDVCDVRVVSNGKNSCDGPNIVERTRWENI